MLPFPWKNRHIWALSVLFCYRRSEFSPRTEFSLRSIFYYGRLLWADSEEMSQTPLSNYTHTPNSPGVARSAKKPKGDCAGRGLQNKKVPTICDNVTTIYDKCHDNLLIDLLMGLFRGAVFRHVGGALKQPIKEPTETPTSTLALMGRFPSLMGRFPTLMGRFTDFVLRGCFTSWKSNGKQPIKKRGIKRFSICDILWQFLSLCSIDINVINRHS